MDQGEWWTAPAEGNNGKLVMVTGRKDIDKFRDNPRYNIRVEVIWRYEGEEDGMPGEKLTEEIGEATDRLAGIFEKDPVAVLTGIFTGDGERTWVFYTTSTHIFGKKLNEALAPMPLLPLEIICENDPKWEAYSEMAEYEIRV